MTYNSKIDIWNILILVGSVIILSLPNFVFNFSWVYFSLMLIFDIALFAMVFMTRYTLAEESLIIRTGFIKFDIAYGSIQGISKKSSWKNQSCATALKCIEIRYGVSTTKKYNKINISPEKEDEFLGKILLKCDKVSEIIDERKK